MRIERDLEINFIRAIQKHPMDITLLEEDKMDKRNTLMREQFVFTTKVYEKLILLNEKLRQEEMRVFQQFQKIKKQCKLMVANKQIDDFNITIIVKYKNNKHYRKYEPSIEGNPFFETNSVGYFMGQMDDEYDTFCWNTLHGGYWGIPLIEDSYLFEINHCYSFHNLYDHTDLTWFDISNIDEFWMEIKVDYQFFRKIK